MAQHSLQNPKGKRSPRSSFKARSHSCFLISEV